MHVAPFSLCHALAAQESGFRAACCATKECFASEELPVRNPG